MDAGTIVALVALVLSTIFSAWQMSRLSKSDTEDRVRQNTSLQLSIGDLHNVTASIKASLDDIKVQNETNSNKIAILERSTDKLHSRVDTQQDRIDRIIAAQDRISENLTTLNGKVGVLEVKVDSNEKEKENK